MRKRRYEEAISHVPNSVPAMLGLAQLAAEDHNVDSALSWLDKASLADPNDLRPSIAKVDLLMAEGRNELRCRPRASLRLGCRKTPSLFSSLPERNSPPAIK